MTILKLIRLIFLYEDPHVSRGRVQMMMMMMMMMMIATANLLVTCTSCAVAHMTMGMEMNS